MTLKSKLARALAFDEQEAKDFADKEFGRHHAGIVAARAQHARLRPILDSLSECVEQLNTIMQTHGCDQSGCKIKWRAPTEALQRLAEKLGDG